MRYVGARLGILARTITREGLLGQGEKVVYRIVSFVREGYYGQGKFV